MQNSFIHQLIDQLPVDNNFYRNVTIIFPTKRACQYFEKALLQKLDGDNLWLPEIISIQEFLYQHSPYVIAPDNELLALLHPIQEAKTGLKQSFVEFYKWGQMMLKDFSEIDQYLIDSKYLFHYIKSLKTIDDDSELSPEQSNLLKQFWDTLPSEENSKMKQNFLKTWQFLSEIYDAFREKLSQQNTAYEGMAYRALLEELESEEKQFSKRNFVLAGFNALSAFEERLFRHFSSHYETKIFWDADQYYLKNKDLEAGLFIRRYQQLFSEKVNHLLTTDIHKQHKQIELVESPLEVAQIDYAITKVQQFNPSETVIVLCDESLLYPLVNSLPAHLDFNITMGYPLMLHPIQTFVKYVLDFRKYQKLKRSVSAAIFLKVIKHALVNPFFDAKKIKKIEDRALIYGYLDKKSIREVFGETHAFLVSLFDQQSKDHVFLNQILHYLKDYENQSDLDNQAIDSTIQALHELVVSTEHGNINLEEEDLYKLIKQSLSGLKLPFDNASLSGLQIMGFLETRNLDFKNIIIVGATDDHLPGTSKSSSFIPFSVRKALSLPTYQENDAIYGYHFYRLLQRADDITLISANSISSASSSPSRFIEQIKYEWKRFENINISENTIEIPLPYEQTVEPLSVPKNAINIQQKFEAYFQNERQISASALNVYIKCPIQFYLKYIVGLKEPEELSEAYDQRILGMVFHKAMELFYQPFLESQEWITSEKLAAYFKASNLEAFMSKAFEEEKIKYSKNTIVGQNVLIKDIILQFMKLLIRKDIASKLPFKIIGLEQRIESIPLKLSNGKTIYMKSFIDRVDLVKSEYEGEFVRIIDYKTGSASINSNYKKTTEEYIEGYFNSDKFKEGFQGYFYAWIYRKQFPDAKIKVGFYSGKQLSAGLLMVQKGGILTEEILDTFDYHLKSTIEEIFDESIPFLQSENESAYQYSGYKVLVE